MCVCVCVYTHTYIIKSECTLSTFSQDAFDYSKPIFLQKFFKNWQMKHITQVSKFRKHLLKMYLLMLFKILNCFLIRIFKAYLFFIKIENQNMREKLDISHFFPPCVILLFGTFIFFLSDSLTLQRSSLQKFI